MKIDIPSHCKRVRDVCFGHSRSKIDPKIDAYLMTHNFFDASIELERKQLKFLNVQINRELKNVLQTI